MDYTPTPQRGGVYLFVKSKISVEHDAEDFWAIQERLDAPFLRFTEHRPKGKHGQFGGPLDFDVDDDQYDDASIGEKDVRQERSIELAWSDTDVLKLGQNVDLKKVVTENADLLSKFQSWFLFDMDGRFIEHPQNGPATHAFQKLKPGFRFALLFARWDPEDRSWELRADKLRASIASSSLPFFYPRQGRAFLVNDNASYQRCAALVREHSRRPFDYAGIDSDGIPFLNGEWDSSIWTYGND